jgi:protein LTV1
MQHLKQVGGQEEGVDSILLEAPSRPKDRSKGKAPIALRDIPTEALPSTSELPRTYESQENIPSSIAGFQPDMDPHLRQTLEALEDDAFVDESLDEDFFGELVAGGEREYPEEVEFEFDEDGFPNNPGLNTREENLPLESDSWEERFAHFKKVQKATAADDDLISDTYSEGGDTIGTLPQLSVLGGKRRRKGTSDASGYSMSSSSMFRNEGLTTLDERFDQVCYRFKYSIGINERSFAQIEKEYAEEEEQEDESTDDDQAPELITSREDFDAMMDEFLDNYEIIGRKLKPVLAGETATDKLNTIRRALADSGPVDLDASLDYHEPDILMPIDVDDVQNRWDCETILSK